MAWEWSHSLEAYDNAYNNIQDQPREWLIVVYAEWSAWDGEQDLDDERYRTALAEAAELPDDVLVDYIWDQMSELQTCTNGGHNAHCCPFGCLCHMVSFDRANELTGEIE